MGQSFDFDSRQARVRQHPPCLLFTLRPSFLLPYGIVRTAEVEKALFWRHWGVPCDALAYGFGRKARFWYRAGLSCGRPHLVGTTVKPAPLMPQDLVAEEKIPGLAGAEVVVPTTVGGGWVRGLSLAKQTDRVSVQGAYGELVSEATTVFPPYRPRSGCTEGFQATREAWRQLVPQLVRVLCFLPAILKLTERCRGPLRRQVLARAGAVYHAVPKAQFARRLRRVAEWAHTSLDGSLAQRVA
jgi:hypothetical protein